ncbi:MAG: DUF4412 domain-containing protein [Chitinophagaceae bacterium]
MKKNLLLFILLTILMIPHKGYGQKSVSDAKVTYTVKVNMPANSNMHMPNLSNGNMVMYIKGKDVREDMDFGMVHNTMLMLGDGSMVSLMDMAGNKYLIRRTKAQIDAESSKYKGITFTNLNQSKVIAGYSCKEVEGEMTDGKTFTVYYTPDIQPENTQYNLQLAGLKGLALQFEMIMNHMKMTLTASKVDLSPLPTSLFDVPTSGYKEMTMPEMGHH